MNPLFFLQSTEITTIPCPKESSDVVYLISTFLLGGGLSSVVNGFFNVKNTEQLVRLQGDLKLEQQKNQHLLEDVLERDKQIEKLGVENGRLSEERTSGFNTRMSDLENMISKLQADKERLRQERRELMERLNAKKQPPPQR